MKTKLVLSVCAGMILTTPALAQDWSSTLSGGYGYFTSGGASINSVGTEGLAAVPLHWNDINLQANGDYHHLWGNKGANFDVGTAGGALVWGGFDGRIAINGQYHMTAAGNATTYGVGGEWFAAPDWTLGLRGGGLSGVGGSSGGYVGGEVIKYLTPDFSLAGGIDYTGIGHGHATDFHARAEYLAWDNLSVYGGYTYTDVPGKSLNSFMIGLKLYCDPDGPTLVDHQRSGPATYISTFSSVALTF